MTLLQQQVFNWWERAVHWAKHFFVHRIARIWTRLTCVQLFINKSVGKWRRRLECAVRQNGGHIEQLFNWHVKCLLSGCFLAVGVSWSVIYSAFESTLNSSHRIVLYLLCC